MVSLFTELVVEGAVGRYKLRCHRGSSVLDTPEEQVSPPVSS